MERDPPSPGSNNHEQFKAERQTSEASPAAERVELVADYVHSYRGYWDDGGRCRIRIFQGGPEPIVVCTSLPENQNTSITNMCEYLAADIADRHFRDDEHRGMPFYWIEHYPRTEEERWQLNLPDYALVRFSDYTPKYRLLNGHLRKRLGRPHWQHLTESQCDRLLRGERVPELPPPPDW